VCVAFSSVGVLCPAGLTRHYFIFLSKRRLTAHQQAKIKTPPIVRRVAEADVRLAEAAIPADPGMQVSHETIYRSLFIQTRGVVKKQLACGLI
jgi:hypothetical protein